jgi:hypothetical protein
MHHSFAYNNLALRIFTMWLFVICASGPSHAQGVYKWVDKDGKVHYGDKRNAPSSSKESDIKQSKLPATGAAQTQARNESFRGSPVAASPRSAFPSNFDRTPFAPTAPSMPPDFPRMAKPEKWPEYKIRMTEKRPENAHVLALGEAALQKCIALAVNLHNMDFGAERNAAHDHFMASCPKVKVECKAYRKKPEMNSCEANAAEDKGPISIFKTTD